MILNKEVINMFDFDDLVLNEDWYSDEARRQLRWTDEDKVALGLYTASGAVKGGMSDNSSAASGALAGFIGAAIGLAIAKGIVFVVYKGKSCVMTARRERAYSKATSTKDLSKLCIEFMNSPTADSSKVKKERVNGGFCIYIKDTNFCYYMTYMNDIGDYVINLMSTNGTVLKTLIPKNKSEIRKCIREYISPFISEDDFNEFMDKGYGYTIHVTDCPGSKATEELYALANSNNVVKKYTESAEDINDLF